MSLIQNMAYKLLTQQCQMQVYHRSFVNFYACCVHRSLDAALVSPGEPIPFPITRTKPDLIRGISYCLANNIWGTNYIMWQPYEPEQSRMRFRFLLQMTKVAHGQAQQQSQTATV